MPPKPRSILDLDPVRVRSYSFATGEELPFIPNYLAGISQRFGVAVDAPSQTVDTSRLPRVSGQEIDRPAAYQQDIDAQQQMRALLAPPASSGPKKQGPVPYTGRDSKGLGVLRADNAAPDAQEFIQNLPFGARQDTPGPGKPVQSPEQVIERQLIKPYFDSVIGQAQVDALDARIEQYRDAIYGGDRWTYEDVLKKHGREAADAFREGRRFEQQTLQDLFDQRQALAELLPDAGTVAQAQVGLAEILGKAVPDDPQEAYALLQQRLPEYLDEQAIAADAPVDLGLEGADLNAQLSGAATLIRDNKVAGSVDTGFTPQFENFESSADLISFLNIWLKGHGHSPAQVKEQEWTAEDIMATVDSLILADPDFKAAWELIDPDRTRFGEILTELLYRQPEFGTAGVQGISLYDDLISAWRRGYSPLLAPPGE